MLKVDCELPLMGTRLSLWREVFWPAEWFALRSSALYEGDGVPRGHGEPVVLVPGFLASDLSLEEMHGWLERIGYWVHSSGLGRNDDCPDVMLAKLVESVEVTALAMGRRVALIGHSMGGTLARAAAVRRPDLISQVICLGSPVAGSRVNELILGLAQIIGDSRQVPANKPRVHGDHFHDGTCMCELADTLEATLAPEVSLASIFSKTDGVVDWRTSQEQPPAANVEVKATHLGLVVNAEAYRAIAWLLASGARETNATARPAAV